MSQSPEVIVKQALVESLYKNYHALVGFLKNIPINQENLLIQEAYKMIDIGIICLEKSINHAILTIPPKEPAPTNEASAIESTEKADAA